MLVLLFVLEFVKRVGSVTICFSVAFTLSRLMVKFICMNRRVSTSRVFKQRAEFYEAHEQLVSDLRNMSWQ